MASNTKYVPPYLRNKKQTSVVLPVVEEVKEIKKTENDFPSLGSAPSSARVFDHPAGKSFATMATEWTRAAEEQKRAEELEKKDLEALDNLRKYPVALPRFHNVRHFVEPEDDEEEEEQVKQPVQNPEEEGWIEVKPKKKIRRPKTFEEKMARPPTPDENSKDDTVWNGEDDDTYWR